MKIRCKECNKELEATKPYQSKACNCPNETHLRLDKHGQPIISAIDLSKAEIIDGEFITTGKKKKQLDTPQPLNYNKRKPRKLDYEVK